jgi:hypothetical protein
MANYWQEITRFDKPDFYWKILIYNGTFSVLLGALITSFFGEQNLLLVRDEGPYFQ